MWGAARWEKDKQKGRIMEQLTEDAMPKISLRELPIINMEYTSQMRLDLESTVTSGEAVNDTVR